MSDSYRSSHGAAVPLQLAAVLSSCAGTAMPDPSMPNLMCQELMVGLYLRQSEKYHHDKQDQAK